MGRYNEIIERLAADGGERTPYTSVFLQEIERMNILLKGIKTSLLELDLGLKGDLQISDAMMGLMYAPPRRPPLHFCNILAPTPSPAAFM